MSSTATTEVRDLADVTAFDADQHSIWAEQKEMYAGFLAGDRSRIDRRIHPDVTIWDSEAEPLARGLGDLNAIRAKRPRGAAQPVVTELLVRGPIITVYGDTAIGRHVLVVHMELPDGKVSSETMRVSSAWRRIDGEWWVVHSHEDVFAREII